MLPRFDEQAVASALRGLSWRARLAFGAACAGRILPNYARFRAETGWGHLQILQGALSYLWDVAVGAIEVDGQTVGDWTTRSEAQTPDSEAFESLFTSSAQDSVFAICALLDFCAAGDVGKVILAARYPTDSIDLYVQELEQMDPQASNLEDLILSTPLMQQELSRQGRDLELLRTLPEGQAIQQLRARDGSEDAFDLHHAA